MLPNHIPMPLIYRIFDSIPQNDFGGFSDRMSRAGGDLRLGKGLGTGSYLLFSFVPSFF